MDEDVWDCLYPFQSVSFIQQFLKKCYNKLEIEKSEAISYRNSYSFLYYLQHGKAHYKLAQSAAVSLQPLLLFYGMTQLMKACLLTKDPEYPKTTAVLAHGVSARKKKKKNYAFTDDEVLIKKDGLAVHFAETLFGSHHLEGEKWMMKLLLERIPDLSFLFTDLYGQSPFCSVSLNENHFLEIPQSILDDLNMTMNRFVHFLSQKMRWTVVGFEESANHLLLIKLKEHPIDLPTSMTGHQFLPRHRRGYEPFPELLVHFLILYNLSMIARYETEWWSELFHQATNDLPIIENFLKVTKKKVPRMVSRYLRQLM